MEEREMCKHENIRPVIEKDEAGTLVVYATVCQDCFKEAPVSPMSLSEYNRRIKP